MALKTPILITYDSTSAYGQWGPLRRHPRPSIVTAMKRRVRKEADRRFREIMRTKPQVVETPTQTALEDLSKADLQDKARALGKHFTTKTTKRDLIGLIRGAQW